MLVLKGWVGVTGALVVSVLALHVSPSGCFLAVAMTGVNGAGFGDELANDIHSVSFLAEIIRGCVESGEGFFAGSQVLPLSREISAQPLNSISKVHS